MTILEQLSDKKIWLAPLAGYTDNSFREICKICGADVVVSEMISSEGLTRIKDKSISYAQFTERQRPFGTQIFGSKPEVMARAVDVILETNPDFIDVNMGCPVKKVIKRGAGAALSKDPTKAAAIVTAMKKALSGTKIPLTVKIRSGWDFNSINFLEMGQKLEDAGADIIILHARTRNQMYGGDCNWDQIKQLRSALTIPVIGNGNIKTIADAVEIYNKTDCSSIMIGRGALGNPWLFNEIKSYFNNEDPRELSLKEKFDIIEKHCRLTVKEKGKDLAVLKMRSHFSFYTRGFSNGSNIRRFINQSLDITEILAEVKKLYYGQN